VYLLNLCIGGEGRRRVNPGMELLIIEGKEEKETNSPLLIDKGTLHHCCTATGCINNIKEVYKLEY